MALVLGAMGGCEGRAQAPRGHSFLCEEGGKDLVLNPVFAPSFPEADTIVNCVGLALVPGLRARVSWEQVLNFMGDC